MRTLSILAGVILVLIGIGFLTSNRWTSAQPLSDFDRKWTFASGELRELHMKNDYEMAIKFVKSGDGTNSVSLTGQGTKQMIDAVSDAELSGGTLDLDLRDNSRSFFNWFRFGSHDAKQEIVVSLTDESAGLDTLGVNSDSGSLSLTDVRVKTADLKIDSGSVTLRDVTADQIQVRADSGSITANGIHGDADIHADSGSIKLERVTGPTRVTADSGSVKLYKEDTSSTDIKADSGSVYVRMPASFAGSYDLDADSGSIHAPDSKGQTEEVVKVRTDSGSIKIEQDR